MNRLPALHRSVGWATLGMFLISGMYMRSRFPEAYAASEGIRYQYRANHLYLLFGALLNLLLARYFVAAVSAARRRAQMVGSTLLLFLPAALVWAFLMEPPQASPHRPATALGIVMAAAGTLLHVLASEKGPEP